MSTSDGQPEAGASEPVRLNLGVRLKAAREARGMTERDVAQRLRLDLHIVRSLEADDLERLPALTFVRGYLRNYARLVGLDEALVREALPDTGEATARIDLKSGSMGTASMPRPHLPWGRWLRNLLLLAVLAVVLILVVPRLLQVWDAWQQRPMEAEDSGTQLQLPGQSGAAAPATGLELPTIDDGGLQPEAPLPEEQEASLEELLAPAEEAAPEVSAGEAPAVPETRLDQEPPAAAAVEGDTVSLVLSFDEDSWVEIEDRESRLLFGLMTAGTRRTLTGQPPFQVLLGNAPGVSVQYRGEPLETAPYRRGKVARFRLD